MSSHTPRCHCICCSHWTHHPVNTFNDDCHKVVTQLFHCQNHLEILTNFFSSTTTARLTLLLSSNELNLSCIHHCWCSHFSHRTFLFVTTKCLSFPLFTWHLNWQAHHHCIHCNSKFKSWSCDISISSSIVIVLVHLWCVASNHLLLLSFAWLWVHIGFHFQTFQHSFADLSVLSMTLWSVLKHLKNLTIVHCEDCMI